MRVAIIGSYPLNPSAVHGGVQAAFSYLARSLARIEGMEVHVMTFRRANWQGPDTFEQDGIQVHLLPRLPRFERLRFYRTYQVTFNRLVEQIQPDILHAQEASADAFVALHSKYPTVITVHGIHGEDAKYHGSWQQRLRSTFDSRLTERFTISQAKHFIAISQYVRNYFSSLLSPQTDVRYIPNAVSRLFFELNGISTRPTVLFAGRVIPLKRVMDLVRAFARIVGRLRLAELRIAGDLNSDPDYVNSIRKWVSEAGLKERVFFMGALKEEAVLREYDQCSLLALASSQENAPMVIAQAMAAGKPVVATRVGGVAEMLGENGERGILVKPGDVEGMAAAMLSILQNPGEQARLGQAGRKYALENYTAEHVAQLTCEAYRQIIEMERTQHA